MEFFIFPEKREARTTVLYPEFTNLKTALYNVLGPESMAAIGGENEDKWREHDDDFQKVLRDFV